MAKYERSFRGNFDEVLQICNDAVMQSVSASVEDSSQFRSGDVRVQTVVCERFSLIGGNRVSLKLTWFGHGDEIFVSAISSGGSQAVFFKINRFGEEAFLDRLSRSLDRYINPGR